MIEYKEWLVWNFEEFKSKKFIYMYIDIGLIVCVCVCLGKVRSMKYEI